MHDYVWILNLILKVVEYLAKLKGKWSLEERAGIEDRILDYLNTKAEPSSVDIICADVILEPIVGDVPLGIAFPPKLKGWQRIKLELSRFPYEMRHRWRIWRHFIPKDRVNKILLKLLREERVRYSPGTQRYSRKT